MLVHKHYCRQRQNPCSPLPSFSFTSGCTLSNTFAFHLQSWDRLVMPQSEISNFSSRYDILLDVLSRIYLITSCLKKILIVYIPCTSSKWGITCDHWLRASLFLLLSKIFSKNTLLISCLNSFRDMEPKESDQTLIHFQRWAVTVNSDW